MDLVDLIKEKRFLGQEFLTWLWYKSEERGGSVKVPGIGDVLVVFEKHMLLEFGEGEAHEKVICQGLQAELKEARTGLAMGKKLEQARIRFAINDYEWHLSIKGSLLEYRNVKLPKTATQADDNDDPVALEGRILERIGMFEMAVRTVDDLFRMFLQFRVSAKWPAELARVRDWIHKPVLA